MTTLALFLFGVANALAGYKIFNHQGADHIEKAFSTILFFGGLWLAGWAVAQSIGWGGL